jgi:hypothetical protein
MRGAVEVVERSTGVPRRVSLLEAGDFTDDIDVLTGCPSIVETRAVDECDTLDIAGVDVRRGKTGCQPPAGS